MAAALTPMAMAIDSEISSRGGAELQRLLDVALQAALALRGQAGRDGDQLLGLAVEHRGLVGLLVELEVDLAEARVDHGVGAGLLGRLGRAVVLLGERHVVLLGCALRSRLAPLRGRRDAPLGLASGAARLRLFQQLAHGASRRPRSRRARRRRGCCPAPPAPARGRPPPPSGRTRSPAACAGRPSCRRTAPGRPRQARRRGLDVHRVGVETARAARSRTAPRSPPARSARRASTSASRAQRSMWWRDGVAQAAVAAVADEAGHRGSSAAARVAAAAAQRDAPQHDRPRAARARQRRRPRARPASRSQPKLDAVAAARRRGGAGRRAARSSPARAGTAPSSPSRCASGSGRATSTTVPRAFAAGTHQPFERHAVRRLEVDVLERRARRRPA